jgi:hypothetical protein
MAREMGLRQPKKEHEKIHFARKMLKTSIWVLWCIHSIDVLGPLFCMVITDMISLDVLGKVFDLKTPLNTKSYIFRRAIGNTLLLFSMN